jgi:hypothetical protein
MKNSDTFSFSILRRIEWLAGVILLLLFCAVRGTAGDVFSPRSVPAQTPVFIQNLGQWNPDASYYLGTPHTDVWCTRAGIVYDHRRVIQRDNDAQRRDYHVAGQVIRMRFANVPELPVAQPGETVPTSFNYFYGADSSAWVHDAPGFRELWYRGVYRGIDIRVYEDGGRPRYDFVLHPGSSADSISLVFDGAYHVRVTDKTVHLGTAEGEVLQDGLYAYQESGNERREVACRFVLRQSGAVGFELGEYDLARPLIIDPLVYSTFIGGTLGDEGYGIALDASGNMYIVGSSLSLNYPTTVGAYDTTKQQNNDIVVSKVNSSSGKISYSTFIGGDNDDFGYSIAVDMQGRAAITGYTFSPNFPVTAQAWDPSLGGDRDIVVVSLSANGNMLTGSTYLGGNNWDEGYAVAMDAGGSIYVTGMSTSTDFPTVNAFDDSHNGAQDVIVAKLSANATTLVYGTFLGGQSSDYGNAIAVDNSGNIYVGGTTGSGDFPATTGSFDNTFNGNAGTTDGFIAKIAQGGALVYSAFLGGNDNDEIRSLAVDAQNSVWVGGATSSPFPGFPITGSAYDNILNGIDGFVAHVNAAGSALLACTYIGQTNVDVVTGIAVDASQNVYITGYTQSSSFPTTSNADDASYNGGDRDAFFARFAPALNTSSLLYATYLGGNNYDEGKGIAVDADGNASVTGITKSNNFPVTGGAYSSTFGGMSDVFVTTFGTGTPALELKEPVGGEIWCRGQRQKIQWTSRSVTYVRIELSTNAGVTYPIILVDTLPSPPGSWAWNIPASFPPGNQYRIRIVNLANTSLMSVSRNNFTINAPPVITTQPQDVVTCVGTTATFQAGVFSFPSPSVQWQRSRDGGKSWEDIAGPTGKQNPLLLTDILLRQHNEQYRVVFYNSCNEEGLVSSSATLLVRAQPRILTAPVGTTICNGGSTTYQWRKNGQPIPGANARQLQINNAQALNAGSYDVVVSGVCPPSIISTAAIVSVQLPPEVTHHPTFRNILCPGETRDTTFALSNSGPLPVTVKVSKLSNPRFSIVEPVGDFVVPAGNSRQVKVRFTPEQARIETGEIIFLTTPCNHEIRVALGARADSIHLATEDIELEPMFQCDRERTAKVRIVNSGSIKLSISRAEFSHPAFTLVAPSLPFDVEPDGQWVDALVKYTDDGTNTSPVATARFISDTCSGIEVKSTLTVQRSNLDFRPAQTSLDFGTLSSCDSYSDQSVMVFNTGAVKVTVDSIAIDNPAFGIVSPASTFDIKMSDFREVVIRFTGAAAEGVTTGTLTLFENKCRVGRSITLTGRKIGPSLASAVASVHLGNYVSCSTLRDTSFMIVNYDRDTATIESVKCDAPFRILMPSLPVRIAPQDSLKITVQFSPVADGDFSGGAVFAYRTRKCSSSVAVSFFASRHTALFAVEPSAINTMTLEGCEAFKDTALTLRNTGRIPLLISAATGAPSVRLLSSLPVTLSPGENSLLRFRVEPVGSDIDEALTLHFTECDSVMTIPIRAHKGGIVYSLSAMNGRDTVGFDDIFQCGPQQYTQRFIVKVTPEAGVPVESSVSLVSLVPAGPFAVSLVSGTKLDEREQQFDVTFTPATDGIFTSVLSLSFLPCGTTKTLILRGRKFSSEVTAQTEELNFGIVQKGGSRLRTTTFYNKGNTPVTIPSINIAAPFELVSTVPGLPALLQSGDSIVCTVRYTAGDGKEAGEIVARVSSPCPDSLTVLLRGEGRDEAQTVLVAAAPMLDFGDVQIGAQTTRSLVISNIGVVPASIFADPAIMGADAALFGLVTKPAASIAPGDSTFMEIAFIPTSLGVKWAVCTIEYNGIPLEIQLTGRGIDEGPAPATSTVFLPEIVATPFTQGLRLPLTLIPGANFSYAGVDSFRTVIRFNASLFVLRSVDNGVLVGDTTVELPEVTERVLTITGRHNGTTELCTLVGDVLLGDALSTPLALDFVWSNREVSAETRNGKLTLKDVSPDMLIRVKGIPGIISISPNPASDDAEIAVLAIEDGMHRLELYDITGREVWTTQWMNRSTQGRLSTKSIFILPASAFASGKYSLRFVAPGGYMNTVPVTIIH